MTDQNQRFTTLATEMAAAYVSYNRVAMPDLPDLILILRQTLASLTSRGSVQKAVPDEEPKLTPIQIRKTITPDALISLIDGKPYKALKRHLTRHGLDPKSYRQKYGLPHDYPMMSRSSSERRSAIAKSRDFGKGSKGRPKKVK